MQNTVQNTVYVYTPNEKLFLELKNSVNVPFVEWLQCKEFHIAEKKGSLALVDGSWLSAASLFPSLATQAHYTVLVVAEVVAESWLQKEMFSQGLIDDVLLLPLRPLELLSKIKHAAYLEKISELPLVNASLKNVVEKLEEDMKTARSIQKTLIPEKFPRVPGLNVLHKYLSGLKSGGEYLDFFEFNDHTHVGMLMSDSSGYGLSSTFLSVLLKLALKLSKDEACSPKVTVSRIFDELVITMKPSELLSIFYGVLNRKTLELSYTGRGTIKVFHQNEEKLLPHEPIKKEESLNVEDHFLRLSPGDRLVICSDGFLEKFSSVPQVLAQYKDADLVALMNEFTYRIKKELSPDDMPEQDCSVLLLDVEKRAMRLV